MSVTGAERVAGGGGMQTFQTHQKCMILLFRYTERNKLLFSVFSMKFDQKMCSGIDSNVDLEDTVDFGPITGYKNATL
jgi:hypothetical protein